MNWKLAAAKDASTSPTILETLFVERDCWGLLAENPNTPTEVLDKLSLIHQSDETPYAAIGSIYGNLLKNKNLSPAQITRILKWIGENELELSKNYHPLEPKALVKFQSVAASNPNTPGRFLREFAKSDYETTLFWLGGNPSLPKDVMDLYVQNLMSSEEHSYCHKWGQIATNTSLSEMAIEKLSRHRLYWVRESIGRNPSTPIKLLMELADDHELLVVSGVIWNPNFPTEGFQHLIRRVTEIVNTPGAKEKDHWTTYLKNAINKHQNATEDMRLIVNSRDWRWHGDTSTQ